MCLNVKKIRNVFQKSAKYGPEVQESQKLRKFNNLGGNHENLFREIRKFRGCSRDNHSPKL